MYLILPVRVRNAQRNIEEGLAKLEKDGTLKGGRIMHLIYRNVNEAFHEIVKGIHSGMIPTKKRDTRNGPTLRIIDPVIITYLNPTERVLFNKARDANHTFHLVEALWMIAGHNDVAPLTYYNSRISEYSDDGITFNGAYGYRWRGCGTGFDQILEIIRQLREDPDSRRCVLQMWSPGMDLFRNPNKDKCCNLSAVFSVDEDRLDMSVYNRSNDLIWGTLGANVVHFSFLLEYMAAHLSLKVGKYHQISCDQHVYTDRWEPEKWLADTEPDHYSNSMISSTPLVQNPKVFDEEVCSFIGDPEGVYSEPFLSQVASPMCLAYRHHKERDYLRAVEAIQRVANKDWAIAGEEWLRRRYESWNTKQSSVESNPYLFRELKRQASGLDQA